MDTERCHWYRKVAFDVTDDRLFTASEDCTVKSTYALSRPCPRRHGSARLGSQSCLCSVWDLQTLQLLKVLPHPDNVYRLYKEANTLITGGEGNKALWAEHHR
jgi:hypothetical protein